MLTNQYLYNSDEVPVIPAEVVMRRIELLQENLRELLEVNYRIRDNERVQTVVKAIEFWELIDTK